MADMHIKAASAWKAIDRAYIKAASAWKTVDVIYVKVGSAWKIVWENIVYSLQDSTRGKTSIDPDDAVMTWLIGGQTSGSIVKNYMQYAGYNDGDAASYTNQHAFINESGWTTLYFRLTYDVGSDTAYNPSNAIDGSTWHALTEDSGNIFWSARRTTSGTDTVAVIVEMATDSGGSNIVAGPNTYTANATVEI